MISAQTVSVSFVNLICIIFLAVIARILILFAVLIAGLSCHGKTNREVHVTSKPSLGQHCQRSNKGKIEYMFVHCADYNPQ